MLTGETGRRQVHPDRRAAAGAGRRAPTPAWCAKARLAPTIGAEFDAGRPRPPARRSRLLPTGSAGDSLLAAPGRSTPRARVARGSTGSPAPSAQLREVGEHLVDIHGQHAWQSLTRGDRSAVLDDLRWCQHRRHASAWQHCATGPENPADARRAMPNWNANASAWPGRSARPTSLRRPPTNGTNSRRAPRLSHAQAPDGRRRRRARCRERGRPGRWPSSRTSRHGAVARRHRAGFAPALAWPSPPAAQAQLAGRRAFSMPGCAAPSSTRPPRLTSACRAWMNWRDAITPPELPGSWS